MIGESGVLGREQAQRGGIEVEPVLENSAVGLELGEALLELLELVGGSHDCGASCFLAGALIGALYGAEALPIELLARMELGWTIDTLARDLISQLDDHPSGTEYSAASDPHWHDRYPSA